MLLQSLIPYATLAACVSGYVVNNGTDCYLYPESLTHFGQPVDDTPSVVQAFELCGTNGTVIFTNHTFHMDQVMNTTNLANCDVEIIGELLWSTNIPYWLSHSINVGLQNQSTAWLFGGTNVTMTGGGSFNGNGQTWYTQNRNNGNEPGRPISITFFNSTNLFVDNISIIQPQFWATFVTYSTNVTMTNIYVNATSNDEWGTVNTDGSDTWNSHDIYMANWTVQNGDDCIAAKGNTTKLHVKNATCYGGGGHDDWDVRTIGSMDGGYIKTWQGVHQGASGNGDGGGGGSGIIRNITFRNFEVTNVNLPIQISQCIYSETIGADTCETSKMNISDVTFENFTGTSRYNVAASLHCAGVHHCRDIYFQNVNIKSVNETLGLPLFNTTLQKEEFQCANIVNQNTTSGVPCNHWAPDNYGQSPSMNVQ
ncbi:hypothetical protein LTR56_023054 [Elasticomyces elasticus]|nr:hypothetical protein LTR56_023054 [Elasticomyces elasticus]KAK3623655.1 hypothetical protein LTR22_024312 [Elasticomyces elasticus]